MLGLLLEQPYLKHKLNNQFVEASKTHYHYNTVMVPKTTIGDQPVITNFMT